MILWNTADRTSIGPVDLLYQQAKVFYGALIDLQNRSNKGP